MVVPVGNQAGQHFWFAQEGTVCRGGTAQHEMVAAAGAGVAAIRHELFGRQPRLMRNFVQKFGVLDQFVPVVGGVNVDLNHARVGGDLQHFQARVTRRWVAFQHDGHTQALCRGFYRCQQVQIILQALQRRHEDVERSGFPFDVARVVRVSLGKLFLVLGAVGTGGVTHFHAQRGAGQPGGGLKRVGCAGWLGGDFGCIGRAPKLHHTCGFLWRGAAGFEAGHVLGQRAAGLCGAGGSGGGGGVARAERRGGRQSVTRRKRVRFNHVGEVGFGHPGHRVQWQAVTHRGISGHQVHALIAEKPRTGHPFRAAGGRFCRQATVFGFCGGFGLHGQHVAHHRVQALHEHAAQAFTLHDVVQSGVKRVHVDRQTALAPQVVPSVFKTRRDVVRGQAQLVRQGGNKALCVCTGVGAGLTLVSEQGRVLPDGLAVFAPENAQGPARQLLARVPLALAEVEKAALAVFGAQFLHQFGGVSAFGRAQCVNVPLSRIAVGGGHKCWLAAHGQAHVAVCQVLVDQLAQRQDAGPLFVGVGGGDAGRLVNTGHAHVMGKLNLGLVDAAFNRRSAGRLGRAGQRDVAFTGHQARSRIQADPASAG